MENQNFGEKLKRTTMRIIKWILGLVILVSIAVFSFFYFSVYETGVMAGRVLRVTQKGVLFKTYEGKLSLESFGALKGTNPIAETFDFSVESSEQPVIKALEQVSLSGERVNLHFVKRYRIFFWRGDTKYFVTQVERVEKTN
jgi:hypothetical protein